MVRVLPPFQDEGTTKAAASAGHLDILKWSRAHGCPWDAKTCAVAAWQGRFDLLRWARETGAPWDEDTCISAFSRGHIHMLLWAQRHGAPVKPGSRVAFTLQRIRQQRMMFVMCLCRPAASSEVASLPDLPRDVLKLILSVAEMY